MNDTEAFFERMGAALAAGQMTAYEITAQHGSVLAPKKEIAA